jgi:flagellar basal body-associated protein FliL
MDDFSSSVLDGDDADSDDELALRQAVLQQSLVEYLVRNSLQELTPMVARSNLKTVADLQRLTDEQIRKFCLTHDPSSSLKIEQLIKCLRN